MKQSLAAIFIAGLTLPLAAQNTNDPVVITAKGIEIHQSELDAAIASLPEEYQAIASGPAKKRFAEEYVRMRLLAHEGEKLAETPEVRAQLLLARNNTLAAAQLESMQETLAVSDEDLRAAYEAEKASLEQVKARHILIAPEGSPAAPAEGALPDAEAKAKAEEIRQKLLAGADFAELAKTESHDQGSGARGGDLGAFGRGMMVPEFEQAAFTQEIGKVGPLVQSQFGYHIIVVDSRGVTPFEEVRDQLQEQASQEALRTSIEKLVTDADVTYVDAYFPEAPAATPPATGAQQ